MSWVGVYLQVIRDGTFLAVFEELKWLERKLRMAAAGVNGKQENFPGQAIDEMHVGVEHIAEQASLHAEYLRCDHRHHLPHPRTHRCAPGRVWVALERLGYIHHLAQYGTLLRFVHYLRPIWTGCFAHMSAVPYVACSEQIADFETEIR